MTRVVFMGTPDFAVPALQALIAHPDLNVVGVVTQPDRPAGRGQTLQAPPVKLAAQARGLPVTQPPSLRKPEAFETLVAWRPDLIVVAAFGQILRPNVLDLPPKGCINGHASLLPRWRGAAPIQAAIRAGDAESGITIMRMDAGLDTGPILAQRAIPLASDETGQTLHDKLADLGGQLLIETLPASLSGASRPQPQPADDTLITYAGQIKKEEGQIDWGHSAQAIDRLVRAFTPWPGTFTFWEGRLLKIKAGRPVQGRAEPGAVVTHPDGMAIGTADGLYLLTRLQLEGKRETDAAAFARGYPDFIGSILG